MSYDDSFIEKEAAKRRMMNWALILVLINFVIIGVLFATGFLHRQREIAHWFVLGELVFCGIGYLWIRSKFGKVPKK